MKDGENIITLQLSVEGYKAKKYTITATKEAKVERKDEVKKEEKTNTIETSTTVAENKTNEKKESAMINMPIWSFVLLQVLIIATEIVVIKVIPWNKIFKRKS